MLSAGSSAPRSRSWLPDPRTSNARPSRRAEVLRGAELLDHEEGRRRPRSRLGDGQTLAERIEGQQPDAPSGATRVELDLPLDFVGLVILGRELDASHPGVTHHEVIGPLRQVLRLYLEANLAPLDAQLRPPLRVGIDARVHEVFAHLELPVGPFPRRRKIAAEEHHASGFALHLDGLAAGIEQQRLTFESQATLAVGVYVEGADRRSGDEDGVAARREILDLDLETLASVVLVQAGAAARVQVAPGVAQEELDSVVVVVCTGARRGEERPEQPRGEREPFAHIVPPFLGWLASPVGRTRPREASRSACRRSTRSRRRYAGRAHVPLPPCGIRRKRTR